MKSLKDMLIGTIFFYPWCPRKPYKLLEKSQNGFLIQWLFDGDTATKGSINWTKGNFTNFSTIHQIPAKIEDFL